MKKILSLLMLAGFGHPAAAQQKNSKLNPALIQELTQGNKQILSVLIKGNIPRIEKFLAANNGRILYFAGDIASVTLPLNKIKELSASSFVERMEFYHNKMKPMDDSSLRKNNILPVHNGLSPLPGSYKGKDVIVGIIDTGTDFKHPDFKKEDGKSRILYIWDQRSAASSGSPQPYNYGIEWTKTQIDNGQCTHTDLTAMSHGTRVTGVATGNGRSSAKYTGIAPEADIITVALDFNNSSNTTIPDAINYIVSKANAAGKPCVINLSIGDYFGPHDGSDLISLFANTKISNTPGRAMVVAAGNSGDFNRHLGYTLSSDTNFTWLMNNPNYSNTSYVELYADTASFNKASFRFGMFRSNNSLVGKTNFRKIQALVGNFTTDTLKVNGKRYGLIQMIGDNYNGTYGLQINFVPDSIGNLWSFEMTGTGRFDAWSEEYKYKNLPSSSTLPLMTKYKRPDSLQTICGGVQCSDKMITVANYVDRNGFIAIGNSFSTFPGVNDSIFPTSSLGPTRKGLLKPDIASTGENIAAPGADAPTTWLIQNYPNVVTADSMHFIFGGTSAAAPCVAGFVALYLQKYPNATQEEIKKDITLCAKKDKYTGPNNNYIWGYGKLDGFQALQCSHTVTIAEKNNQPSIELFPNPFNNEISILTTGNYPLEFQVYDLLGKIYASGKLNNETEKIKLNMLNEGLYLLRLKNTSGMYQEAKIIKQ